MLLRLSLVALLTLLASGAWSSEEGDVILNSVRWTDEGTGVVTLTLGFSSSPQRLSIATPGSSVVIRCAARVPEHGLPDEDLNIATESGELVLRVGRSDLKFIEYSRQGQEVEVRFLRVATEDGYRIGPGDLLDIVVYREPDLSGEYRVAQDGTITLALAGPVGAAGLTESELARVLEVRLGSFIKDPRVSVTIRSFESQFVYVAGAVSQARKITLRPGRTVLDVLAEAGVALVPGQRVVLVRHGSGSERIALEQEDLSRRVGIVLRDGDLLEVSEPLYVYVRGEVREPQRILWRPDLRLQEVITLARGLTDWANKKRIVITRRGDEGSQRIVVNLKLVEQGEIEDVRVSPGDVVVVTRKGL